MKSYRLKSEAVPFVNEKHATSIYSLDTWQSLQIDVNALEEVEDIKVVYGHWSEKDGLKSASTSGWDKEGARFHFTLHFPSIKFKEYDKFSKGKVVRKMIDKIQSELNYFYEQFNNEGL